MRISRREEKKKSFHLWHCRNVHRKQENVFGIKCDKKSPVVSVNPLVYIWFHCFHTPFFQELSSWHKHDAKSTKGKSKPWLPIVYTQMGQSQTSTLQCAVSVSPQSQITANTEFRELRYETWEDTVSRVKHNVLSHGSLSSPLVSAWVKPKLQQI